MATDLLEQYNYDSFTPEKVSPWMRFHESPAIGDDIPDFKLWQLGDEPTSLSKEIERHRYTVIEFGSFT